MRALLLSLTALVLACTPARRKVDSAIVRDIAFEGNGGAFSDETDFVLRSQLVQKQTNFGLLLWPLMYTVTPRTYDVEALTADAYRLEVWYAHHGWLDANVTGWHLRRIRNQSLHRASVLDVVGHVESGPRTMLDTITVEGGDGVLVGIVRSVLRNAEVQEGGPLDLDQLEATRLKLLEDLHNSARAYATVAFSVDVRPEEQLADVTYVIDAGPVARFGSITVEGLEAVPPRFVRQKLGIEEGDSYSVQEMRDGQRALFELGTFSVVTVEPDLSDRTNKSVPLKVRVTEAKFGKLRFGGGASYDSFLPQARVSARIEHVNLFHQLLSAELGARAGYAFALDRAEGPSRIPIWGADLALSYPRLFRQRGTIQFTGEVEQDIFSGLWAYRRPQADLALIYRFSNKVTMRVGPHAELYTFLYDYLGDKVQVQNAQLRLFGVDSGEDFKYQLTTLDQFFTFDYRDDKQRTERGSYYTLSLREALPLTPAGYSFVRVTGDARRYVPIRMGAGTFPFTLVGRVRGTAIQKFGKTETIPLPERTFLGGATSIRGFRSNQVGSYATLCTYDTSTDSGLFGLGGTGESVREVTRYYLPDGANLSAESSAELRYRSSDTTILATFVDFGVLGDSLADLAASFAEEGIGAVRASAGVGVRYDTQVGPIRLDLSLRPLYAEDQGPRAYLQCDEVDEIRRVSDFFGNFPGLREDRHPPFGLVFFLTIGESI